MPRDDYRRCKECGREASEVGPLSHTRLCIGCAVSLKDANNDGIHERRGPFHDRRVYGIIRRELGPRWALALKSAGAFPSLLDDSPRNP